MRFLQLILAVIIPTGIYAQRNQEAQKYYDKGIEFFIQQNYIACDSLLSKSILLEPNKDAYFDLALTKQKMEDTCGFCFNLKKATEADHLGSDKMYHKHCIKTNTIIITDTVKTKTKMFDVIETSICSNYVTHNFYRIDEKNDTIMYHSSDSIRKGYLVDVIQNNKKFTLKVDTISEIVNGTIQLSSKGIKTYVEEWPDFIGGDDARIQYLWKTVKYPQADLEKGISGTVYVRFDIDEVGNVTNVRIIKKIGGECDQEVLNAVNNMPKWTPAKFNGKPIKSGFTMPYRFTLQ